METLECSICGKDIKEGAPMYATATGEAEVGSFSEEMGFMQDDNSWHTEACADCGNLISEKINELVDKLYKKGA